MSGRKKQIYIPSAAAKQKQDELNLTVDEMRIVTNVLTAWSWSVNNSNEFGVVSINLLHRGAFSHSTRKELDDIIKLLKELEVFGDTQRQPMVHPDHNRLVFHLNPSWSLTGYASAPIKVYRDSELKIIDLVIGRLRPAKKESKFEHIRQVRVMSNCSISLFGYPENFKGGTVVSDYDTVQALLHAGAPVASLDNKKHISCPTCFTVFDPDLPELLLDENGNSTLPGWICIPPLICLNYLKYSSNGDIKSRKFGELVSNNLEVAELLEMPNVSVEYASSEKYAVCPNTECYERVFARPTKVFDAGMSKNLAAS